jgi:hypothetical protein
MATQYANGKIATEGLVFMYDTIDTENCYKGRPTTNTNTHPLYVYNNVPDHVSSTLTATSETYKGVTVYKQDLTALNGTGASYLSNGNNPGIGVYTWPGGGGNANTYTGHSIFFKTSTPLYSTPIFLHYSNIPGYQACCTQPEDMGDGWYRAYVLWYDTVTRSDGKFWAINPSSVASGQTITVYWAGPFREDLNSTSISQFVNGTRSATQGLLPLVGNSSLDLSNISFTNPAINPQITFDGSNDKIDTNITNIVNNASYEVVLNCKGNVSTYNMYMGQYLPYMGVYGGNTIYYSDYINGSQTVVQTNSGTITYNTYYHVICTREYDGSNTTQKVYINGNLLASGTFSGAKSAFANPNTISIGDGAAFNWYPFYGDIPVAKVYNRTLTSNEVTQNYNKYKIRFNLS